MKLYWTFGHQPTASERDSIDKLVQAFNDSSLDGCEDSESIARVVFDVCQESIITVCRRIASASDRPIEICKGGYIPFHEMDCVKFAENDPIAIALWDKIRQGTPAETLRDQLLPSTLRQWLNAIVGRCKRIQDMDVYRLWSENNPERAESPHSKRNADMRVAAWEASRICSLMNLARNLLSPDLIRWFSQLNRWISAIETLHVALERYRKTNSSFRVVHVEVPAALTLIRVPRPSLLSLTQEPGQDFDESELAKLRDMQRVLDEKRHLGQPIRFRVPPELIMTQYLMQQLPPAVTRIAVGMSGKRSCQSDIFLHLLVPHLGGRLLVDIAKARDVSSNWMAPIEADPDLIKSMILSIQDTCRGLFRSAS